MDAALNPAVLDRSQKHSISISATPARYGLTELAEYKISYNHDFGYLNTGLRCSMFGFELYKELITGLTISKQLFANLQAGINANYNTVSIKNYGSNGIFSIDVGILHELSDKISYGISLTNLTGAKRGNDKLDQVINAGINYKAFKELLLSIRMEKNFLYETCFDAGIEYKIIQQLPVRFGMSSEPEIFYAGFGFEYLPIFFDYAFSYHNILGNTHSFSISVDIEK